MVTKSKSKPKSKPKLEKEKKEEITIINEKPVITNKIEFPELKITNSVRYEMNYISVRRKLIALGKKFKIIRDKPIESKKYLLYKTRFNIKFWFDNLWNNYCVWFNNKFNRKVK